MINRMISEIRSALSHELYLSALTLALTLPDTCGKAEYSAIMSTGKRYKNWCKKYVIKNRHDTPYDFDMPYLNEEIIYSLRCTLLHQSTPNIDRDGIHEERFKVDEFELVASQDSLGDTSKIAYGAGMRIVHRGLRVHISHLCYILCEAAEHYYEENKEKFGFIQYSLVEDIPWGSPSYCRIFSIFDQAKEK